MYKIIIVHLVMFAALFAVGLPALQSVLPSAVGFHGGIIAVGVLTLLSEVAIIAAGILSRVIGDALGINPLLERNKSGALSAVLCVVFYTIFLVIASAVAPLILFVTLPVAAAISVAVTVALFVMLEIKRAIIRAQP
jgi:hypothetical protein